MLLDNRTRLDFLSVERKLISNVRGGGTGNRAWLAELIEKGGKFGYERKFVKSDKSYLSNSGRSGCIVFLIEKPGVYEYRGFGGNAVNCKTEMSGFLFVTNEGVIYDISQLDADKLLDGEQLEFPE